MSHIRVHGKNLCGEPVVPGEAWVSIDLAKRGEHKHDCLACLDEVDNLLLWMDGPSDAKNPTEKDNATV